MKQKYTGTIDELKALIESTGIQGELQSDRKGMQTFRSVDGGVLNWWSNGTIQFQGKPDAKAILELSLEKLLARKTSNVKPDGTN